MSLQMPPQSSLLKALLQTSCPHLRSQIRNQLLRGWQVWHKARNDLSFFPATKLSAIFTLPSHAATRLFQMKLAVSYLLGHPKSFPETLDLMLAWYDTTAIEMLAAFI